MVAPKFLLDALQRHQRWFQPLADQRDHALIEVAWCVAEQLRRVGALAQQRFGNAFGIELTIDDQRGIEVGQRQRDLAQQCLTIALVQPPDFVLQGVAQIAGDRCHHRGKALRLGAVGQRGPCTLARLLEQGIAHRLDQLAAPPLLQQRFAQRHAQRKRHARRRKKCHVIYPKPVRNTGRCPIVRRGTQNEKRLVHPHPCRVGPPCPTCYPLHVGRAAVPDLLPVACWTGRRARLLPVACWSGRRARPVAYCVSDGPPCPTRCMLDGPPCPTQLGDVL